MQGRSGLAGVIGVVALVALTTVGCGDDDGGESSNDPASETTAADAADDAKNDDLSLEMIATEQEDAFLFEDEELLEVWDPQANKDQSEVRRRTLPMVPESQYSVTYAIQDTCPRRSRFGLRRGCRFRSSPGVGSFR